VRGSGICPFSNPHMICEKTGCEWWDEYEHDCAINIVVRELRKLNNKTVD
jgi:hypothetical protein